MQKKLWFVSALFILGFSSFLPGTLLAYPIHLYGGDEASFTPNTQGLPIVKDTKKYDVIIAGGGIAGLAAAVFLSDRHKSVLLLEKESQLGGLAARGKLNKFSYNRGSAYWPNVTQDLPMILKHVGMGDYKKRYAIYEPIDSYFWNGKLYLEVWHEDTLKALPASFALFKHELIKAADEGLIPPDQPLEEAKNMELDKVTMATWVRNMPNVIRHRSDPESQKIYQRFLMDKTINRQDPMIDVLHFLDLYGHSAVGGTTDQISAFSFANSYISEVEIRFASPIGTGEIAKHMEQILIKRLQDVSVKTHATVIAIANIDNHAEVTYLKDNMLHQAKAKFVVYALQLKFAPKIIANLPEKKTKVINKMGYANYAVHNVFVKGHPYRASYDTWMRLADYSPNDFSDFIIGRWMDPTIKGYEGMRDFKKSPLSNESVLTIYHHLPVSSVNKGNTNQQAIAYSKQAVSRLLAGLNPFLQKTWGTRFEVLDVETSRWPYGMHIATPGFYIHDAKILRIPFGRIFFANNNMGTPTVEEAMFRGHCAANNILYRFNHQFKQESWTACPLEPIVTH